MKKYRIAVFLLLLSMSLAESEGWAVPPGPQQPHHAKMRARVLAQKWARKVLSRARMNILRREVERNNLDFAVDQTTWVSDKTVFRGDKRAAFRPATVFNEGMDSKGGPAGDVDLVEHVQTNTAMSRYVSTSTSFEIAKEFGVNDKGNGYVYAKKARQGLYAAVTLQGNTRLRNAESVAAQKEVSVLNRVEPHEILGAFQFSKGSSRPVWVPNPNFR